MKNVNRQTILLTASLGNVLVSINATLINNGLPAITRDLKIELSTSQWIVTGYLLTLSAIIPLSGYLCTRFGPQRIFLMSIAIFTLSSLLCGLSNDAAMLILFRITQAIGGGGLLAVSQSIALNPFKPHERATANTILNLPGLAAPVFGPLLGGWLIDSFNWQALFLINVFVGVITLVLTLKFIPNERYEGNLSPRLDVVGLFLTLAGIILVMYAFAEVNQTNPATRTITNLTGETYGWGYWQFWLLAIVGVVLIIGMVFYELFFTRQPLLNIRLYKDYNFRISSLLIWCIFVMIHATFILMPIYFQRVHVPNLSASESGLLMAGQGVGTLTGILIGGKIYNRFGLRLPVGLGMLFTGVGMWQSGQVQANTEGASLVPWLFSTGLGLGLAMLPVSTHALQHLNGAELASGSSLFIATRQIFGSLGTAVVTSLLIQFTNANASQLKGDAAQPSPELSALAGTAANNSVFTYLALGCLATLILLVALPAPTRIHHPLPVEEELEVLTG